MDELHARRLRRRRARSLDPVSAPPTPERESAESVLPEVPRVGALDALLREIDGLRLTLETDLTLAAAAVETGQPRLAADIIDSDRKGLQAFEGRALGHLEQLATPRRRVRVPAAPFVAAAAVAGFLLGVVPHLTGPSQNDTTNVSSASPTQSLMLLEEATTNGDTAQALEAVNILHGQLTPILLQAKTDPAAAAQALALLSQEQHLLAGAPDAPALIAALQTSRQLTSTLRSLLRVIPSPTPVIVVVAPPASPRATYGPTASPRATTRTAASPAPAPKPTATTAPRPTGTPAPSPSASQQGPLPGAPSLH